MLEAKSSLINACFPILRSSETAKCIDIVSELECFI